jgi:hypothetical protein
MIRTACVLTVLSAAGIQAASAAEDRPARIAIPAPLGVEEVKPAPAARPAPPPVRVLAPREQGLPQVEDRMGDDQTRDELVRTSLLNRFGGLGFAAMRDFRRQGDLYAAEVMTTDRRWISILVDPRTGEIIPRP